MVVSDICVVVLGDGTRVEVVVVVVGSSDVVVVSGV